jgi:hypothetical protein
LFNSSPGSINSSTGLFTWTVPTGTMHATISIVPLPKMIATLST